MSNSLKKAVEKIIRFFPLKNIIIFESLPDYSDNSRAVFDEMIKRGVHRQYQLVWTTHKNERLPKELAELKNVIAADMNSFQYKYYYSYFAKAFVVCNYFMQRRRAEQYYIYLAHGAAFKAISDNRYSVPQDCYGCDFSVYSNYIGHYDIQNLNADESIVNMVELGYARNDALLNAAIDVKALFPDKQFSKLVYWLPTFRQKISAGSVQAKNYSSISIPVIHNEANAVQVNECAKENNVLVVVKPHPAQDLTKVKSLDLSNIVFINESFLTAHNIKNYELLGASDALLSDYSSVYYDYLLCDKPIGLCWEDFEEYKNSEGFRLDPFEIMAGGEKLYTTDDLCQFITDLNNGIDRLKNERNTVSSKIHQFKDNKSSERTVNHILNNIDR